MINLNDGWLVRRFEGDKKETSNYMSKAEAEKLIQHGDTDKYEYDLCYDEDFNI